MAADYQRIGLVATARQHESSTATIYRLLVSRGLIERNPRRLARALVGRMYWEYVAGLSLAEVGVKYDRTRQSVFELFKSRGLKLRSREFLPAIEYKGRKYTMAEGHNRYYRATVGRGVRGETFLHHVLWVEAHGPIPPGHKVCFKDRDRRNCVLENLELLTNAEQTQRDATGVNGFTRSAPERLRLLMKNFESGAGTLSAKLKARAAA